MSKRPILNKTLNSKTFLNYYYLKEELVAFCKEFHLPTSGGKEELTKRIAYYLDNHEILPVTKSSKKQIKIDKIALDMLIEENFVCSQTHREFFKTHIGKGFSFNVAFQQWLKNNAGKTYQDAIEAYAMIKEDKKKNKTAIDKQFEYNTYIRDFFRMNKDKTLEDAIQCWKYKKQLAGHNRYEESDLIAIKKRSESSMVLS